MLGHRLVVVSDAHLGAVPTAIEEALLTFLDAVPTLGDALLINGDLFDFWCSYDRVIPRRHFRAAAALAQLRRRVPIVMVGGNHDRWGGSFWLDEANIVYEPWETRFQIGDRTALAIHGDGLTDTRRSSRILNRVITHRATAAVYRALPPSLGFWLVESLAPHLGDGTVDERVLIAAEARQREWAGKRLAAEPALDFVIMAHTHRPAAAEVAPGRFYVNSGAWMSGLSYAVVEPTGVELRRWT